MSKALFGHGYRLQVAAAIDECREGELYPEAIAERFAIKEARVGEQLRHFAKVGMLIPQPRDGRRQPYVKRASPYWALCRQLRDELLSGVSFNAGSRSRPS